MPILLPPSERKLSGGNGAPLTARTLTGPLSQARASARSALAVAMNDPRAAAKALALPESIRDEALSANSHIEDSPTMSAITRYRGVLYDGLEVETLTPCERSLAKRDIYIFSGLFGVVRGSEMIPDYRVPAAAALPGLGIMATFWRPVLQQHLAKMLTNASARAESERLILDLRSTDYCAMWRPDPALAGDVVTVQFVSPTRTGLRVVSFSSKLAKGQLSRAVLQARARGESVCDAHDVQQLWMRVTGCPGEIIASTRDGVTCLRLQTQQPSAQ